MILAAYIIGITMALLAFAFAYYGLLYYHDAIEQARKSKIACGYNFENEPAFYSHIKHCTVWYRGQPYSGKFLIKRYKVYLSAVCFTLLLVLIAFVKLYEFIG